MDNDFEFARLVAKGGGRSMNGGYEPPEIASDVLQRTGRSLGFDLIGVCSAEILEPERTRYLEWQAAGRHGNMQWITDRWIENATAPGSFLSGARSVICVALSYAGEPAGQTPLGKGRIARYANGPDYHGVLDAKLASFGESVSGLGGRWRSFVDTAPTMDKALAVRAGLGWQGKNTNILNTHLGSFVFLGGLVTDLEVPATVISSSETCGPCHACVAACPTGALKGDYTIDARLCISYLTIEHRGSIPRELRSLMGSWIYGCDLCQDVCPVVTRQQDAEWPERKTGRVEFVRSIFASTLRSGPDPDTSQT